MAELWLGSTQPKKSNLILLELSPSLKLADELTRFDSLTSLEVVMESGKSGCGLGERGKDHKGGCKGDE